MRSELVLIEVSQRVATVTIDRPDKLNALDADVLARLGQVIAEIAATPRAEIAGVVLTGTGDRAFVAGADIAQMAQMTPTEARAFAALGQSVPDAIEALDRPVIAAVSGYALGGGCELALGCDFIYATSTSQFAQPEVSLGLIPCFGGCTRLVAAVGAPRARELVFTGRMIGAAEAERWGLVNRVLEDRESLIAAARETLALIATRGPIAVAESKAAIATTVAHGALAGLAAERDRFAEIIATADAVEGTAAFLAKRGAGFVDR